MTVAGTARDRRLAWIAWGAVCILWGTTYFAITIALVTIPPFLLGGLRNAAAGLILGGFVWIRGRRLPRRQEWGRLALLGFCMFVLGNGGVVWGQLYVPSGLTAVMVGAAPFWMVSVDAVLRDGRQLHAREWVGLGIGFLGIVLLVWPDVVTGGAEGRGFALGVVAIQLACAGWALGSAYSRRTVLPGDVLGSAAAQMVFGGLMLLAVGSVAGEWDALQFSGTSFAAFAYLTLAGSVVAFAAYSYALQHLDVAVVSLYTYINPVIAVALGTLLLDEPFHLRMLVAALVIVVGIAIVGPASRRH